MSLDFGKRSVQQHKKHHGKLEIRSKVSVKNRDELSVYYTPGVAAPCEIIAKDPEAAYELTIKRNTIAVVTDGSAVLGLGNIGGLAGLPVMEGKAILFKQFADVDAFPICLSTQDPDEVIKTVKNIAPVFGGINLEDIKAPNCFYIEERLKEELHIPIFHDDQHGTAIVILAGLLNALALVGKKLETAQIVIAGAGAAGIATARLLLHEGARNIMLTDRKGIIYEGRDDLNLYKERMAKLTNRECRRGTLADAMVGADVLIGVSHAGIANKAMVKTMNRDAIIFAMANPTPEITPEEAFEGGAKIIATGRSDYPNQINNVLVFPGLMRGVLDCRARYITDDMKVAAARALAKLVKKPRVDKIIPGVFDKDVAQTIARAVKSKHDPKNV
ncbi:NAD-dependent malic enzyme [Candidatus Peregrinibacteria bacterium CG_4_9_14_0_2_um_filter_53_11]|nr:MAG: NAD-dependent malic enzyme [Candidatus Peregrinibacteria bacterium CG_4_9_14_0_2_um_filter_53_11]